MAKADKYAKQLIDMYAGLQQHIFETLIYLLQRDSGDVNKENVLAWQVKSLARQGLLTDKVVSMVAELNKTTPQVIYDLIMATAGDASTDTLKSIQSSYGGELKHPDIANFSKAYYDQTMGSIENTINETLMTRNVQQNAAVNVYRDIVVKSTMAVSAGLKTHDQAVRDTVYEWVAKGIPTKLTASNGAGWSLEAYSRMLVTTTQNRVNNEMRLKTMATNDVTLALMSWHNAAREACAPIQGHIVNMVPPESKSFDDRYDSIFNHGFGKASGTLGINCRHQFTPWNPKVNVYHPDPSMPSAKKAMEQSGIQQHQRSLERAIRQNKKILAAAEQLHDGQGIYRYKSLISNQQSNLRDLIKDNPFLQRDYAREQVQSKLSVPYNETRQNDSQSHVKLMMSSGQWGSKINADKQADHLEQYRLEGKSYLLADEDADELLKRYSGTGTLNVQRNGQYGNKETVHADHIVGVDADSGMRTAWFKIHHSKGRTHIVPTERGDA